MKKTLLLVSLSLFATAAQAQVKSTGTVNLLSGMTAKLDLDSATSQATLTLTGPSDRWFALQFGSFASGQGMEAGLDVVYFNGTTLIDATHNGVGVAPSADTNNWTTVTNTVASGTRTIVATRSFAGGTGDYAFVYANTTIDFAFAKMSSASFSLAYHGGTNRGYQIDVPINTSLSVDDIEANKKIALYPNPTNNAFSIRTNDEIKSVLIYDANGRKVASFSNQKELLDISKLQTGLYFVEVENSASEVSIERLVKK